MSSRAGRVSSVATRVYVVVIMLVLGRFHLGFGVCNVNRTFVLMMTVMALHMERSVRADQHFDMLTDASRQRAQRIPAFKRGDDATIRILVCDRNQLLRQPAIVRFHPTERGQFVITMCVKTGRNHDQLWLELV